MKIFVFEYTSGGGAQDHALPDALMRQGAIMHRALIADLSALPDVALTTLRDARLPLPDLTPSVRVIPARDCYAQHFDACVQDADAVWLVAPESGGILEQLSRKVQHGRRILLGSAPEAVRQAGCKLDTAHRLAEAGIPVVATYAPTEPLPDAIQAWVVKPGHGAGCIDTRLFSALPKARAWIADGAQCDQDYVLQPFIAGQSCSLSLLCQHGAARLLSCNRQRVAVRDNQFHFLGSTVNGIVDADGACARLAQQIAGAMPGLWGYVGVDLMLTAQGMVVLEVNPRMTTSFAGLHAAIGCNPAQLVLDLLSGPLSLSLPAFKADVVGVDAEAFDAL